MKLVLEQPIILTLDAGGTNFVFSAMRRFEEIVKPVYRPSYSDNLNKCIETIIEGFEAVIDQLEDEPASISFAFPGPADYSKGIIGDLPNFKAFNGDVPLGPILENRFHIPVFINNDGNLFAYGEALNGFLPSLNNKIKEHGGIKQYKNLIGLTLGTGFGCGIVLNENLVEGDNSSDAGIHNTLNKWNVNWNAEESVSTRAIQRVYAESAGIALSHKLMPKDIYEIAKGLQQGVKPAALESFRQFGEALGSSIANILTLIDGIVVVGGGIASSWDLFSPSMFQEINRKYEDFHGNKFSRLSVKVYNLEDENIFEEFAKGRIKKLKVPGSGRTVTYDDIPRVGIGVSKLSAGKAISIGAYAYAMQHSGE